MCTSVSEWGLLASFSLWLQDQAVVQKSTQVRVVATEVRLLLAQLGPDPSYWLKLIGVLWSDVFCSDLCFCVDSGRCH